MFVIAAPLGGNEHASIKILGLQQIAIGGLDKAKLAGLWGDVLGLEEVGEYQSEKRMSMRISFAVVPVCLLLKLISCSRLIPGSAPRFTNLR